VYLERPWFSSGKGEQLAVVLLKVEPEDTKNKQLRQQIPRNLTPYVTQWGLDPLRIASKGQVGRMFSGMLSGQSNRPAVGEESQPRPEHFLNAASVRHNLVLEGLPTIGSLPVTICAFDVQPDSNRKFWYCDIDLDPGDAYFPFVRLAVARYQPNSIKGAHLSQVVRADFAQLVPDRSASAVRQPGSRKATVSVAGPPGLNTVRDSKTPRPTSLGNVVSVSIEQQTSEAQGELGWSPVPNTPAKWLTRNDKENRWVGEIDLPAAPASLRCVIREYELYQSEEGGFPAYGEPISIPNVGQFTGRLVYAEVLPMP
jgi:hypothetical protein